MEADVDLVFGFALVAAANGRFGAATAGEPTPQPDGRHAP